MTIDGGTLAVSGTPTINPELALKKYSGGFLGDVVAVEEKSLELANEADGLVKTYANKFNPKLKRINKRVPIIDKELGSIDRQIVKTKDQTKVKELKEIRKTLAEERSDLVATVNQIEQAKKSFEKSNPRVLKLQKDINLLNLTNQAILQSLTWSMPDEAASFRHWISEMDKLDSTGRAASSFVGVNYGAGNYSQTPPAN